MGMDVELYQVSNFNETIPENPDVMHLTFQEKEYKDFTKSFPKAIGKLIKEEFVDIEKLKKHINLTDEENLLEWDFTQKDASWLRKETISGEEVVVVVPDVEMFFYTEESWKVYADFKTLGYMRKPFRHYSTQIKSESNCIVINTDNFTGSDISSITKIIGDTGDCVFTYDDLEKVKMLGKFCYSEEEWVKNFVFPFNKDSVLVFNW